MQISWPHQKTARTSNPTGGKVKGFSLVVISCKAPPVQLKSGDCSGTGFCTDMSGLVGHLGNQTGELQAAIFARVASSYP